MSAAASSFSTSDAIPDAVVRSRAMPEATVCLSQKKVVIVRDEHTGKEIRMRTLSFKGIPERRLGQMPDRRVDAILQSLRTKPAIAKQVAPARKKTVSSSTTTAVTHRH